MENRIRERLELQETMKQQLHLKEKRKRAEQDEEETFRQQVRVLLLLVGANDVVKKDLNFTSCHALCFKDLLIVCTFYHATCCIWFKEIFLFHVSSVRPLFITSLI